MVVSLTKTVVKAFLPSAEDFQVRPLGSGLIHQTLLVESECGQHVFQRLNGEVFPDLDQVMHNIDTVTNILTENQEVTLSFLRNKIDGSLLLRDGQESCWRCSVHLPGTVTYDVPPSPAHLKNAAKAFAKFGQRLSNCGQVSLHPTIQDFHHTPNRYTAMEKAWDKASEERRSVPDYFALRHAAGGFPEFGLEGLLAPHVPQSVSHNDTKLNNCLFRESTEEVVCVIDLDTVMEGTWLMDFGDLCRTAICAVPEDTDDLDLITIDQHRFQALVEGYAEILGPSITQEEKDRMVYSVFLLTYELALRFFTDYLQNDRYFGAKYPEHNLVRTRSQLTLALRVLSERETLEEIVKKAFQG